MGYLKDNPDIPCVGYTDSKTGVYKKRKPTLLEIQQEIKLENEGVSKTNFLFTRRVITEKINKLADYKIEIITSDFSVDGENLATQVDMIRLELLHQLNNINDAGLKTFDYISMWDEATDFLKPDETNVGWWSSIMSKLFFG